MDEFGDEERHGDVRAQIVAYHRANPDHITAILIDRSNEDETVTDYITRVHAVCLVCANHLAFSDALCLRTYFSQLALTMTACFMAQFCLLNLHGITPGM